MTKEERKQLAYDNFKKGYNCCQSVVLAYADVLPPDKEILEKVTLGFGAGFGRTRNLCGAVSAFGFVTGPYGVRCPARSAATMDPLAFAHGRRRRGRTDAWALLASSSS